MGEELTRWAMEQRALARALDLTIEAWLVELQAAGDRRPGLTAAVIGASMAKGLGLGVLDGLDGPRLAQDARVLVDPQPPRVKNPFLKEAIRRADELDAGLGARRLKGPKAIRTEDIPTPRRGSARLGPSARTPTPDAPGEDE